MTDWRRQTGRQAFFFSVIGSSSARIKERLADGNVIVVEVIREPVLARGLLGVFDISLCDEVVVGLITCGRLVLGQGAKVLSGSTQGTYPRHHGSWRCRDHLPALTLAWLYIEPSPCGGVRPAGDPVDSDPGAVFEDDPHPRSDASRPLEPWVCRHTREPTVLSRLSCRPPHLNFDRFHQPCLFP